MAGHDIVVIGGSAGSQGVLKTVLAGLPADLDAALFITVHLATGMPSALAEVLAQVCPLPVATAVDGAPVVPGTVTVASPGRHMLLIDSRVRLGIGPRENMARPAIDPLFRSAAISGGPRVIGIVLTGMLDDGASGLAAIRRCGGVAIVQDPIDAAHDEMPRNAIAATSIDHLAPAAALPELLTRLVATPPGPARPVPADIVLEVDIAAGGTSDAARMTQLGSPIAMTCPACSGVLSEMKEGRPLRYRCQTGHAYTAAHLRIEQENAVDEALRVALRIIDERAELVSRMGLDAARTGRGGVADLYRERAEEYRTQADTIRRAVLLRMA